MTRRSSEEGRDIPRIRDPHMYELGQWDLDKFDGCFSGSIAASDIDGVVERRGKILFFEFKGPGATVDLGQDLTFRSLVSKPGVCVLVVRGPRHEPQEYCFWTRTGEGRWVNCGWDTLRYQVACWFAWADGQSKPSFSDFMTGDIL